MPYEKLTDSELIERCLGEEAQAWETLIQRYKRLVYSVPVKMGLTAEDSQDVFQETFATLLRKLGTVRDRERIGLWLSVIARRKALDLRTRGAVVREVGAIEDIAVADGRPLADEDLYEQERHSRVRQAIATLPGRCRGLLAALYYHDPPLSYAEAARKLDMKPGSLGPTRLRCLERLRRALGVQE